MIIISDYVIQGLAAPSSPSSPTTALICHEDKFTILLGFSLILFNITFNENDKM